MLTLLLTSPRVAPGLMSWPAWQAVAGPGRLLASSRDLPVCRAVTATGREVATLPEVSATSLLAAAASGPVVWLASDDEADRLPGELAAAMVAGTTEVEIEVLHASYDVPGARLLDLVTVMDQLRLHCPWDREQTHRSLATYLVEETYETLEAIESADPDHLREELGDLLLQVYFHARIADETAEDDGGFTIDDVAAGIVDKLVHRHPHVFERPRRRGPSLAGGGRGQLGGAQGIGEGPGIRPRRGPPGTARAAPGRQGGRAGPPGVGVTSPPGSDGVGGRPAARPRRGGAGGGADPEQELREAVRRLVEAVRSAESAS